MGGSFGRMGKLPVTWRSGNTISVISANKRWKYELSYEGTCTRGPISRNRRGYIWVADFE